MLELLFAGLALGAIYALVALGFVFVYRATGMINFAQGDMTTAGAFMAYWAVTSWHLPLLLGWVVSFAALALVGAAMYFVVYRPLANRSMISVAIGTLGVALVIRGALTVKFGENPSSLASPFGNGLVRAGPVILSTQDVAIILIVAVLVSVQALIFRYTFVGKSLRAISEDREMSQLLGLRVNRLLLGTVIYGALLAALAGVLLAPILSVSVGLGWELGLTAFASAIVGGFGSMPGALLGGVLLGVGEEFAQRYVAGGYADSVVYALVLVVLVFRPAGIVSMLQASRA
jgi:branched-chain amino acid transport system permease protein